METNERSQQFGQTSSNVEQTKEESDRYLIEGGATRTEQGELRITDAQYNHLHQLMEEEIQLEKQNLGRLNMDLQHHWGNDLFNLSPKSAYRVAKTMIALLEASQDVTDEQQYLITISPIIFKLSGEMESAYSEKEHAVLAKNNAQEFMLALAMRFPKMSDKEKQLVKEFFERKLLHETKREVALEDVMREKLGLKSEKIFDPERESDPEAKMLSAFGSMLASKHLEDFQLVVPEGRKISNEELEKIVDDYFISLGYTIENEDRPFWKRYIKGEEKLFCNITNDRMSNVIMVTIGDLGHI